jgi:16S rRNA A1518/A1519 N6-dimethyltransferase RsmA/KsgA/DIM1 with predicted DNA glycosylase/AP lyase activity
MTFIIIGLFVLLVGFMVSSISGAPWVPARSYDVEKILDDVDLQKNETYLELGCGDGRLVRAASRRGAIAIGYELNPLLWLIGWLSVIGNKNAHIKFGNFWNVDLSSSDVIMAFLVPRTMPRLGKKADAEIKKPARLISYIFPIPNKKYTRHTKCWYIYSY